MSEEKSDGDIGNNPPPEGSDEAGLSQEVSVVGPNWRRIRYNYTQRPSSDPEISRQMHAMHSVNHMLPDMDRMLLDHRDQPVREKLKKYGGTLDERFGFSLPDGTPLSKAEKLIVLENALTEAEGAILAHETELLTSGVEFNEVENRKAFMLFNRVFQELNILISDPVEEATEALRERETDPASHAAGLHREEEVAAMEKQFTMDPPEDIPAGEKIVTADTDD